MNSIMIFISGAFIIFLTSCNNVDDYRQISHHQFLTNHKYNIGQKTILVTDSLRARPIKTEIWYPTMDTTKQNITMDYPFKLPPTSREAAILKGKFPLIMLSHGTGGNRISQMWLATELVGDGYIVASVNHWGNTFDNKIPENFVKIWDRPLDIKYVITKLIEYPDFQFSIDTARIGAAGFSLGGYTTIALAGGIINYDLLNDFSKTKEGQIEFDIPELGDVSALITPAIIKQGNSVYSNLKDKRITAFLVMSPAIGQGFSKKSQFKNIDKPVLIIGAENDNRTPAATNARHYHELIKDSEYIELEGKIGHYIFLNDAKSELRNEAPLVFKDDESVNRGEIHNTVSQIALDFFNEELKRNINK